MDPKLDTDDLRRTMETILAAITTMSQPNASQGDLGKVQSTILELYKTANISGDRPPTSTSEACQLALEEMDRRIQTTEQSADTFSFDPPAIDMHDLMILQNNSGGSWDLEEYVRTAGATRYINESAIWFALTDAQKALPANADKQFVKKGDRSPGIAKTIAHRS